VMMRMTILIRYILIMKFKSIFEPVDFVFYYYKKFLTEIILSLRTFPG